MSGSKVEQSNQELVPHLHAPKENDRQARRESIMDPHSLPLQQKLHLHRL